MPSLVDRQSKAPKYLQLAEYLRDEIDSGKLAPHERLPSFNEMKDRFDATQRTVEKAHTLLENDGLIRREPRRGIFVNDRAKRSSGLVALLDFKPARQFAYFMEVQRGMRQQLEVYGKSIAMVDDPSTFEHWEIIEGILLQRPEYLESFRAMKNFPTELPIVRLHFTEPGTSSVVADDVAGITYAVEHLLNLGHRRIGYLLNLHPFYNDDNAHPVVRTRYQVYCQVMEQNGITPDPLWVSRHDSFEYMDARDFGYCVMRNWLHTDWREQGLTAMLAQNDHVAIGMIRALAEEGIRVPEDLSIVGFDGLDTSDYAPFQLTTVEVPLAEIGTTATRLLCDHINQPARPCETVTLPVRFHVGESTAEL